jgi:hypothetical protein
LELAAESLPKTWFPKHRPTVPASPIDTGDPAAKIIGMAKPARPELIFHSIDDLLADAARLRAGPYEKAGEWDLAMILDHLGKAMEIPSPVQKSVPWPVSVIARAFIRRMTRRGVYPSFKIRAPKAMQPTPNIPLETADAMFRAAAGKIKTFTGPTVEGTPFGALPREDFIKLHLLHGAHHLSFLRSV